MGRYCLTPWLRSGRTRGKEQISATRENSKSQNEDEKMRTRAEKRREKVGGYFGQERHRRNLDSGLVGDVGGAISCGLAA